MLDIVGYFSVFLMGLFFGLLGGGGSIVTVPILVYLFRLDAVLATGYSMFIVFVTSFFSYLSYLRTKLIRYKQAFIFAIPSFVAVYISRVYLLPFLGENILFFSRDKFIIVLFSLVMLLASLSMLKKPNFSPVKNTNSIIFLGFLVGLLLGIVGAGGGFLIVPVLTFFLGFGIKESIATSIFVITLNTFVGFISDIISNVYYDWSFLLKLSTISIFGVLLGVLLSSKINPKSLKKFFAIFVLLMAISILLKEIVFS